MIYADARYTTVLPEITDELWEEFNDTCLMTWNKTVNRPDWTQIAVDFACVIPVVSSDSLNKRGDI